MVKKNLLYTGYEKLNV